MAYSKKETKKETKSSNWFEVDCEKVLENDLVVTKLTFYPIYKNGLVAKCSAEINGCLVLDNILISEKSKYIQTPCDVYEKDGEKKYKPHYFFIKKGVPSDFGNFIIEQLEKHS